MDGISPIDGFLTGRLGEDELLAEAERIVSQGSVEDRTTLLTEWRTKSGRIRAAEIRRRLDATVAPLAWGDSVPDVNEPVKPLEIGDILANRFVVAEKIGSGGMGAVFKARDLRREEAQDRQPFIAIKTLNAEVLSGRISIKILQREARKAQGLSHPNIVRVYDFDRDGNTLFITMELLEGTPLDQIIQNNGLQGASLENLLPIFRQVVSALEFAHAEGIVHSDLKPANIIVLPNGRVKVIDFGISRAIPNPNQQTSDRTTFNVSALGALTPAYASPEMIDGLDPDPADDVFALACIAYEDLTGRHPFGRAPASIARAGNFAPKQPASLSPAQWSALLAGMRFDRTQRTASPRQLLDGLEATERRPTRRRNIAIPVALGVLALGVLVGFGWYFARGGGHGPSQLASEQADSARIQAQQHAAEEAARLQAQQKAAEEAARQAAEQKAAQEAAQQQAQQKAAEEAARQQAEQKAAEEAARQQAQQKAAQEAAQQQAQQPAPPPAEQIGPPQVAEAQQLLTRMGLPTGGVDGRLGPRTQEMLRAFQSAIGEPSTGDLTPALLNALRGEAPPASARGKALFTLAADARRAQRLQDAARLYEQGLRFAPQNIDALLALGDTQRDLGNSDAARQTYRTAQQQGAAANIVAARLAGVPAPQAVPPVRAVNPAPPERQAAARQPPVDAARPFDGTYAGTENLTGLNNPGCRQSYPVTIVVSDNKLTFSGKINTTVAPDGSFSGYGTLPGGNVPVAEHLTGTIHDGVVNAQTVNPYCKYSMSLRKQG